MFLLIYSWIFIKKYYSFVDFILKKFNNMSFEKCYNCAMDFIEKVPRTEKELYIQLIKKHFSEEVSNKVIKYLKSKKIIDDKKVVEIYIHSDVIKKWKPIVVVEQKLLDKGVDKGYIDSFIKDNRDDIQKWMSKKIKELAKEYRKRGVDDLTLVQKILENWYSLRFLKEYL